MKYFDAISETSYLSVPNAPVYRKIMRCFYREYEKLQYQLYKEDIYALLKQDEAFENYSIEQLALDLDALVKWKNLTPIQDPGRVYTIADYKNKQYRYTWNGRDRMLEQFSAAESGLEDAETKSFAARELHSLSEAASPALFWQRRFPGIRITLTVA